MVFSILFLFTPVTPFFTGPENDLTRNCGSRSLVYNVVCHLWLACLVFDISWNRYPPQPVGTKLAQTPIGARLKSNMDARFEFSVLDYTIYDQAHVKIIRDHLRSQTSDDW